MTIDLFKRTRPWLPLLVLAASCTASWAQTYPDRLIRIIVPFTAGGTSDVLVRVLAKDMSETLKQPIVVENKPGATGIIGSQQVQKSKPDGYTLLFTGNSALITGSIIKKNPPFDAATDFVAIGRAVQYPLYMLVGAAVPANTMSELVAYAKSKPDGIFHTSNGVGSIGQLACERVAALTGIKLTFVPYNGIAAAQMAVINNDAQLICESFVSQPFVERGQMRGLAVMAKKRLKQIPNVPTLQEAGLHDAEAGVWLGLFAPAGTPKDIVDKISHAMQLALKKSEFMDRANGQAMDVVFETPAEAAEAVKADRDMWTKVIRDRRIPLID